MNDSATHPFRAHLSRGCKVHFDVGPTHLLPSRKPYGLLRAFDIPLRRKALAPRLGPATRCSGAYRDGTFTRKSDTARLATSDESSRRTMPIRIASYLATCHKKHSIADNHHTNDLLREFANDQLRELSIIPRFGPERPGLTACSLSLPCAPINQHAEWSSRSGQQGVKLTGRESNPETRHLPVGRTAQVFDQRSVWGIEPSFPPYRSGVQPYRGLTYHTRCGSQAAVHLPVDPVSTE